MLKLKKNITFALMILKKHIQKFAFAAILILAVQILYASNTFSGDKESNKKEASKYSLKNLSKYSNKPLCLNSAKYTLKLNSTSLNYTLSSNSGLLNNSNSTIEFTNGNTTFIYPYKMKIKVPKFKTPAPNKF